MRLCLTILLVLTAVPLHANTIFVTTTDFTTGSSSELNGSTKSTSLNVANIHSDAVARFYNGLFYVVNRAGADNIQALDPNNNYNTVIQFSVGNGSNPHDIAFASPTKAYVTRYDDTAMWIVNPQTGAMTGTIDFSSLADAQDGLPEMDQMAVFENKVFVSVQRLNRNNFYSPTGTSYLAVIDINTDTFVDTDAVTPGVQPITLTTPNPFSEIQFDPYTARLYLSSVGFFGLNDGGVVTIDPVGLVAEPIAFGEAAAGGDIVDVEIVDHETAYAIVSTPTFVTDLIKYNPTLGTKDATVYSPGAYVLQDIERSPFLARAKFSCPTAPRSTPASVVMTLLRAWN